MTEQTAALEMRLFSAPQFGSVRTIIQDNEPWFVAVDICTAIGLSNTGKATQGLDDDELTRKVFWSGGQSREMIFISEPGMYSLILRSNKPEAKAFKRWVTHDVLPEIRRTGAYGNKKVTPRIRLDLIDAVSRAHQHKDGSALMKLYRLADDLGVDVPRYNLEPDTVARVPSSLTSIISCFMVIL